MPTPDGTFPACFLLALSQLERPNANVVIRSKYGEAGAESGGSLGPSRVGGAGAGAGGACDTGPKLYFHSFGRGDM